MWQGNGWPKRKFRPRPVSKWVSIKSTQKRTFRENALSHLAHKGQARPGDLRPTWRPERFHKSPDRIRFDSQNTCSNAE